LNLYPILFFGALHLQLIFTVISTNITMLTYLLKEGQSPDNICRKTYNNTKEGAAHRDILRDLI